MLQDFICTFRIVVLTLCSVKGQDQSVLGGWRGGVGSTDDGLQSPCGLGSSRGPLFCLSQNRLGLL